MADEKSCGAVVFTRRDGEIYYVIVRENGGYYGFPKGHVEPGESEGETALREIWEETGLRVRLRKDFREEESHPLTREGRPQDIKHTVYFLAEYSGQTLCPGEGEVASAELMDYDRALATLPTEGRRRVLRAAARAIS